MGLTNVPDAIAAIGRGELVIVVDDVDRENEGDLILAAEKVTPEAMSFMIRYTSGVICAPLSGARLDALEIPLMVSTNSESHRTAFTVSVDAVAGTSTGISAADRTATIRALVDPATRPQDLARPGHVFPLRYREGGVLKRPGHTEASVDLARLAGGQLAGVLAEIVNDDGSMARRPDLDRFAAHHKLILITIADLIAYRRRHDNVVHLVSEARLPTLYGEFSAYVYQSEVDGLQHLALAMGPVDSATPMLVRVHSECLTGDVFASRRCDCGVQLERSMQQIADAGAGVLVYLRGHEGRGIGLGYKVRAYHLQDQGYDTVDANLALGLPVDSREYDVAAQILGDLNVKKVRLLTNNPTKFAGLENQGVEVVERIPLLIEPNEDNERYLRAKQERMGHLLGI